MHDLRACQVQHRKMGKILSFELGRLDVSLKFTVPQVVVGRDEDIDLLFQAFDRVSAGGLEVLLVSGEPGIGKSTLVGEVQKPVMGRKGYFLSGKYDQIQRYVPYSALIQAFQGLARRLLAESTDRILAWKGKLLEALGPNGKIITAAIPEIELITGPQPDVPELGVEETQNRFNLAFRDFMKVFASPSHPLVLFLDDLQWADTASLNLLRTAVTDKGFSHFLLIGSYRDDEVGPRHPFTLALDEIRKKNVPVQSLKLSPLDPMNVNRIVSNFLRCGLDMSASLSMVVHEKTLGNPFFVIQFIKTLYEDRYLVIDPSHGWLWDMSKIRDMQVSDNVVDLMSGRIARLPEASRALVTVCACVGNRFEVETLAAVTGKPVDEIMQPMEELIRAGMITYANGFYRFLHDRIQEAACSLISPKWGSAPGTAPTPIDSDRFFDLATTDGLTKLFTHRYFQLLLDQEIRRTKRSIRPFCLIMIDLDDFREFNETYGIRMGDEALRRVARALKSNIRVVDTAARYGGDEFALLLPDTGAKGGLVVAEKVRRAVEEITIPWGLETLKVTISLGFVTFPLHALDKDALIASVNAALGVSKREGRNRVSTGKRIVCAEEDMPACMGIEQKTTYKG